MAGNAIADAACRVREKLVRAAAALLEARADDLEVAEGRVFVRGVPDRALPFARIVQASLPTFAGPGPAEPDFEATSYATVPTVTYASAVHVAVVEVDVETGRVRVLRYVVSHDCGRMINPMIVEGQVAGGVAQGLGLAMLEHLRYDENGQILTTSLMDYLIPSACDVPHIEFGHLETPSPLNPLGIKGAGEAGVIPVGAVIASAIEDALGVPVAEMPLSPQRLFELTRS